MATRTEVLAFPAVRENAPAVPWFVWASVISVTSAIIGGHWDISWHRSIGRDTFWTPAHIAIYLCGILAGVSCAYLILATTFGKSLYPIEATVKMWGFRGPIGAFLTAWGGVAMLTSAPFDNWWHSAYGLDVKILSPPHILLMAGVLAIQAGGLLLILGYMNRAEGVLKRTYNWLFPYTGGMILLLMTTLIMEYSSRVFAHSGFFYRTVALAVPIVVIGVARTSDHRWAFTIVAAVYTVLMLGFEWILPLFPAEPKLGPVFNPITSFVPPQFPLLLIVPAVALDLLWPGLAGQKEWIQAAVAGVAFLLIFLAVQWPFADFLMSPAAHNWFFGAQYQDYATSPNSYVVRGLFFTEKTPAEWATNLALAFAISIIMSRVGIAWSDWMRKVQR